jgi:hypothetical protein
MKSFPIIAAIVLAVPAWPETPVNPDAAIMQDFERRVADYMQLRKNVESKLPRLKPTESPNEIRERQNELATAIRDARKTAKQGDIFTSTISTEFRRLVGLAMQGKNTPRVERSMKSAEPVKMALKVNDSYPAGIPRQSTPPTLLMNLPRLPPELEYRILGASLTLLDSKANLVIDVMPNAVH